MLEEHKQRQLVDALASTDYENAALSMPMDVDIPLPDLNYMDYGGEVDLDTPLSPATFAPQSRVVGRTRAPPKGRGGNDRMDIDSEEGKSDEESNSENFYARRGSVGARVKARGRSSGDDSEESDDAMSTDENGSRKNIKENGSDDSEGSSSEEVLTQRPRTARQMALAKPKKKQPLYPSRGDVRSSKWII